MAGLGSDLRSHLEPGAADAARHAGAALGEEAAAARALGAGPRSAPMRSARSPSPRSGTCSTSPSRAGSSAATMRPRPSSSACSGAPPGRCSSTPRWSRASAARCTPAAPTAPRCSRPRPKPALVRAELAAISGKLNPHFLFNTLNSIIFLTRKDAAAAERALLSFARMLRYLLDANRGAADRVPLREELDFVRDYLGLESLRLGARLAVVWQIDAAATEETIPPLTLQPLVENAIVHGIAPRTETGTVHIECSRLAPPDRLLLRVRDDGAGCDLAAGRAAGRRRRPRRPEPALRPRLRRQGALQRALGAGRGLLRRDRPARERRRIMKRTTTLIAEDEPLASEGLADWVRQLPELELVGVRADGARHPARAARACPRAGADGHPHAGDERPAGAARPRRRSRPRRRRR